jgi:putative NADPH-quinone reductase
MRALIVYCHPDPASFTAALRDVVMERLRAAGAEMRLIDLHAEGFDPVLGGGALAAYGDRLRNRAGVEAHVAALLWCDTLIFVHPTWWYGPPAMLKGWMDRVLLPGAAFDVPPAGPLRPGLRHIRRLAVFTSCGASRWIMALSGQPGRRQVMRGIGWLCAPFRRRLWSALYRINATSAAARARHLARVARQMDRFLR